MSEMLKGDLLVVKGISGEEYIGVRVDWGTQWAHQLTSEDDIIIENGAGEITAIAIKAVESVRIITEESRQKRRENAAKWLGRA